MNFIYKLVGLSIVLVVIVYLFIMVGAGIYNMHMLSQNMDDLKISIPLGQMVCYMLFTTLCFFLKRYSLGLMISFAYIFNWGFLHATANFVDETGNPTLGLFLYLGFGLTMAVLFLVVFIRNKVQESQSALTPSKDRTSPAGSGQEIGICPTCHQGQGMISNSLIPE